MCLCNHCSPSGFCWPGTVRATPSLLSSLAGSIGISHRILSKEVCQLTPLRCAKFRLYVFVLVVLSPHAHCLHTISLARFSLYGAQAVNTILLIFASLSGSHPPLRKSCLWGSVVCQGLAAFSIFLRYSGQL